MGAWQTGGPGWGALGREPLSWRAVSLLLTLSPHRPPAPSEMKQRLDEEGSKCSILSKHQKFVEHCCMRCCAPFTFLVNTKRRCGDCKFNVCKGCCSYQKREKVWVCCVCQQARWVAKCTLRVSAPRWHHLPSTEWGHQWVVGRHYCLRKGRVTEEFSTFGVSDADRTHPNLFNQSMKEDDVREKLGILLG